MPSRLEQLRMSRIAYHDRCNRQSLAVCELRRDCDLASRSIASIELAVRVAKNDRVLMDAALLDGSTVRQTARQLLVYWRAEEERMSVVAVTLETQGNELRSLDPAVHLAAAILQAV